MPLFRLRAAVHRARFRTVVRLFAWLAVTLTVFIVLIAVAYIWNHT